MIDIKAELSIIIAHIGLVGLFRFYWWLVGFVWHKNIELLKRIVRWLFFRKRKL